MFSYHGYCVTIVTVQRDVMSSLIVGVYKQLFWEVIVKVIMY